MRKLIGKILIRSDTSANWSKNNPVLGKGECGYATDLRRTKHGDGTTKWNSLKWDDAATANGHTVNADVPAGAKFTDTTYVGATSSSSGLMSASDKSKLDGIASTYATKGELNNQISSVKTGAIDQIVNLTAAGWTGAAAPYSQSVSVTGMKEDLLCELFSACSKSATVAERKAYNKAYAIVASGYAETADGKVTFSVDKKPAIDIGVRIKSISKANAVSDQTSSDITSAVDAMGNTMWEKIYPVGSIYISVNSTNPAALFGGTWERIKDRFLLAAGDTYKAGSTGGEAMHTLTKDEMPRHTHRIYVGNYSGSGLPSVTAPPWTEHGLWGSAFAQTGNSSSTLHFVRPEEAAGNSLAHNNMPPYIAVYMWQRTA